jgi:hypothetical protein
MKPTRGWMWSYLHADWWRLQKYSGIAFQGFLMLKYGQFLRIDKITTARSMYILNSEVFNPENQYAVK